jgi:hypothetical protein
MLPVEPAIRAWPPMVPFAFAAGAGDIDAERQPIRHHGHVSL